MANATAITVTNLTADAFVARPTADTLDTGTAAVTLSAAVGSETSRALFEFTNTAAANLTVAILAGDNPPAFQSALGNISKTLAQNEVWYVAAPTSSRFVQDDSTSRTGRIDVTFTPASGTIGATVRCYKLPKA